MFLAWETVTECLSFSETFHGHEFDSLMRSSSLANQVEYPKSVTLEFHVPSTVAWKMLRKLRGFMPPFQKVSNYRFNELLFTNQASSFVPSSRFL
jgi:hypothetical protein